MNKYLKLFLFILLAVPLTWPMIFPAFVLNAVLGEINYNLLIYHHPLDWGAESFIGSSLVWAVCLSLAFCLTIFIASNKKTKFSRLVLYFAGILAAAFVLFYFSQYLILLVVKLKNKFMDEEKEIKKGEIVIYQSSNKRIKIDVKLDQETVWLSLNQIAEVFNTDKSGISRHIRNIYKSGELDKNSTVAKIATVQIEGKRKIERNIEYYNLDAILSVGYRVNSKQATKFRIWATKTLKDYLVKGYAINEKRLLEARNKFKELQQRLIF